MRILVVEDERALCETIVRSLRRLAYSVDPCYDGDTAIDLLGSERYDLVLLDLNLPGADGMTVLRTLRQTDRETRVLILSARSEVADKVEGLDAGANDYLAKPFHLEELEARIRSLTLRQFTQNDVVLHCGPLSFDTRSRAATAAGQPLAPDAKRRPAFWNTCCSTGGGPSVRRSFFGARLGQQRGQFQQLHPGTHFRSAEKLRTALGYDPVRNRIGEGYLIEEEQA